MAIEEDSNALKYVRNQTTELCILAVREGAGALRFVQHQTPQICEAAVETDDYYLRYILDPELRKEIAGRCGVEEK